LNRNLKKIERKSIEVNVEEVEAELEVDHIALMQNFHLKVNKINNNHQFKNNTSKLQYKYYIFNLIDNKLKLIYFTIHSSNKYNKHLHINSTQEGQLFK
jgi:hypothetical protein